MVKFLILVIAVFTLTACTSNRVDRYKDLKADISVLCEGDMKGLKYEDSTYHTSVSCNGNTFKFQKQRQSGFTGLLHNFLG